MPDLVFAAVAWIFVLGAGAAYALRAAARGRARSARADRDGGSALLSKHLVELCLWTMTPFTAVLARMGVTPDGVTWFSLLPGLAAGAALVFGWFGLAALLGMVAAFCDAIDGLLARRLGRGSEAGETLDAVVDRYTEGAFLGGLVVYYRATTVMMTLSILALIGSFMISYTTAKAEAQGVDPPRGVMRRGERALYLLVAAGLVPFVRALVPATRPFYVRDAPIVAVVVFIAAVGNYSVVSRMRQIRQALAARGPAARPE
jgi:CDP-diacylglycerol---glycerol-3-phosphate 3-phosphatidyltransferase